MSELKIRILVILNIINKGLGDEGAELAIPAVRGDLVGYDEENCFNSPSSVSSESDSLTNEGFADSF